MNKRKEEEEAKNSMENKCGQVLTIKLNVIVRQHES